MPQYFGQLQTLEQPWSIIGTVKSYNINNCHIDISCTNARFRVSILAPNLIRVRFTPKNEFLPRRSWAVTLDDSEWEKTDFDVQETPETIDIKTEQIQIKIFREGCRLHCYDLNGQPFACDAETSLGWRTAEVAGWKHIEADEHFYGFGERTGLLDKRSEIKTHWTIDAVDYGALTDEMYQAIPFFMALRPHLAYGLFLNTTYWSQFDIGVNKPGTWRMQTQSQELDYYIVYGPEPAKIVQTYTQLTGRMSMPPLWAIGYHQSRWGYDNEEVIREIADGFRTRDIPCDVIHLDIDYMRGFRVFTWSPKRFPNPTGLLGDLKEAGFKVVTIVDPGVKYEPEADYSVFDEGLEKDYFVRNPDGELFYGYVWPDKSLFPDFIRPEVRYWWGECHKSLTDVGVAGIWNDMNEPSISAHPFGDKDKKVWFPMKKIWFAMDAHQGPIEEGGTHAETHNIYGLMMARSAYEALERLRPNERSFVLTRSGYAGIQRWSSVWMGDNQAVWGHLEESLPMLCNMGLSGVAFVGSDIGGFAQNSTAEMFARWMQVGILYPFMRAHSAMGVARREPWVFGDRIESICREFIRLRYQLIPYLYTLFWNASLTGEPILRPLLYEYPNDAKTYELHDQVFLGSSLMAAPICRPGVEYRAVYLPEGVWFDWWTRECFEGSTHILAHAPLETMPLYVKAGSIIPMQPVKQYLNEEGFSELTLRVYPGDGEFTFYEDDGQTFNYRQGEWATTLIRVSQQENRVIVEIAPRQGQWKPPSRKIIVQVVGIGEKEFVDDGTGGQLQFP